MSKHTNQDLYVHNEAGYCILLVRIVSPASKQSFPSPNPIAKRFERKWSLAFNQEILTIQYNKPYSSAFTLYP